MNMYMCSHPGMAHAKEILAESQDEARKRFRRWLCLSRCPAGTRIVLRVRLSQLWAELQTIPVGDDGKITQPLRPYFDEGTDIKTIHVWFRLKGFDTQVGKSK